jgi:GTPase
MRVSVKLAKCGQVCTVGIKLLSYAKEWLDQSPNAIRRGMVLIESKSNPKATHEFTASLMPYGNNTQEIKITGKYQPVINTLTTRQICDIIFVNNNEIEQEISSSMVLIKKKSRSID